MDNALKKIRLLREEGERFTYDNFSEKSQHGYPNAYKPEWVAWRTRVTSVIDQLVGPASAPADMLKSALRVAVIGNGADKFALAQSYALGALRAVEQVLQEDTFNELRGTAATAPGVFSNRVFIVHGHDEPTKNDLEALLREMGLEPVVLHRVPDEGQTIIEKFEKHSDVGFAFIIMTPDEYAFLASQREAPESERVIEPRPRPNVLFEFGFFVGRLGRPNVCCLLTGGIVPPSDLSGVLYKPFLHRVEEVSWSIAKELRARGYSLATTEERKEG
jgi:predicted nucleotide-binding protein